MKHPTAPRRPPRSLLVVALTLSVLWPHAAPAQSAFDSERDSLLSFPLPDALDRIARGELPNGITQVYLLDAADSGDPAYLPILRQIAGRYTPGSYSYAKDALYAMLELGEPANALLARAEDAATRGTAEPDRDRQRLYFTIAGRALSYAAVTADSSLAPRFEALWQTRNGFVQGGVNDYRLFRRLEGLYTSYPFEERVGRSLANLQGTFSLGGGPLSYSPVGPCRVCFADRPQAIWAGRYLARLAAERPAQVRAAVEAFAVEYAGRQGLSAPLRQQLLGVAGLPQTPGPNELPPTCSGQTATVYVRYGLVVGGPLDGQPYAGRLTGTDDDDVIVGTDGPDLIEGMPGDDLLCGGPGDDAIDGGKGEDTARAGDGTDGCDTAELPLRGSSCDGPIPVLEKVRPIAECVVPGESGRFTAYFGYENLSEQVGRVPYGADNALVITSKVEVSAGGNPELFALPYVVPDHPGQTPSFPRATFSVDVAPPSRPASRPSVSWTLLGDTVTASPGLTPTCPAP